MRTLPRPFASLVLALAACQGGSSQSGRSAPPADVLAAEQDAAALAAAAAAATPADANDEAEQAPSTDVAPQLAAQSLAALPANLWLHTHAKNLSVANDPCAVGFYRSDNTRWQGRGVVIHDRRGCDSCVWQKKYDVTETLRRIDLAVDVWHANVLRLVIESYAAADQGVAGKSRVDWQSLLLDDGYLQSLKAIVDYIGSKRGVYVEISMWRDASFSNDGLLRPTLDSATRPASQCAQMLAKGILTTSCTWKKLAETFRDYPYVLFNVAGELAKNVNGQDDAVVFPLLNACVQAIRDVENAAGTPHHIVTVPGTRDWARSVAYFASTGSNGRATVHPITAGGGDNVAYQVHPYASAAKFSSLFLDAAKYLPVIVGEFGPYLMSNDDMQTLIDVADRNKLPYIAWSMHPNCGPATMLTEPGNQCDGSSASQIGTNDWGSWLRGKLAANLADDPVYTNPAPTPTPMPSPTPAPAPTAPAVSNLARGKVAMQSSTLGGFPASYAVDGNPSTLWTGNSIAHTADRPGTTDPYWQVDLGEVRTLTSLTMLNRSDAVSERLQGAIAFVSTQPFASARVAPLLADATVFAFPIGRALDGGRASLPLGNVKGRYVRIALPGDHHILALAEVQVNGI